MLIRKQIRRVVMNPQDPTQSAGPNPEPQTPPNPGEQPGVPTPAQPTPPAATPEPTPAPAPGATTMPNGNTVPPAPEAPAAQPMVTGPMPNPATPNPGVQMDQPGVVSGGGKKGIPKPVKLAAVIIGGLVVLGGVAFAVMTLLGGGVAMTDYSSERMKIAVQHPEGWDVNESSEDIESYMYVTFQEPTDLEDDSEESKYEAEISINISEAQSEFSEIEEDEFFQAIEENVKDNLGKQEGMEDGEEYGELRSSNEITVDGYRALRIDVDIVNFEDDEGQMGEGSIVFVYVDKDTQITLIYEGHSSDSKFFKAFDTTVSSFDYQG